MVYMRTVPAWVPDIAQLPCACATQESRRTYVAGWRGSFTYGRGRRDGEIVRPYTVRDGFIAKPGRVA